MSTTSLPIVSAESAAIVALSHDLDGRLTPLEALIARNEALLRNLERRTEMIDTVAGIRGYPRATP